MLFSTIFASFSLLATAFAVPIAPRDVIDPKITSPTASTVWVPGNQYTVTWDTSDFPPLTNITNLVGQVVLGQFDGDSEHLDIDSPLAKGFLITDGHVGITVPNVPDGNYFIVLFGDSGNTSPQFKILKNPLSTILSNAPAPTSHTPTPSAPTSANNAASSPSVAPTPEPSSDSGSSSSPVPTSVPVPSSVSSESLTSVAPSGSSSGSQTASPPATLSATNALETPTPTSNGASSWLRSSSSLTFVAAALSVVLIL